MTRAAAKRALLYLAIMSSLVSVPLLAEERPAAPPFRLPNLVGAEVHLADYRGKIVLLNFWATWCMPCRQEMPAMEKLWQRYRDQGLVILAVASDEGGESRVRAFVRRLQLSFPVLLDADSRASDGYQVSGIPVSYLIDREGRIAGKISGSKDWMSEPAMARVEQLLAAAN